MRYKNEREAKNGDKIVLIPTYGSPIVGILYDAVEKNGFCVGRLAPTSPNNVSVELKEVLHLDDVLMALAAPVPDRSEDRI